MNRLQNSVEAGGMPASRIYAVNLFESQKVVADFLTIRKYPFVFVNSAKSDSLFNIEATPSIVFIQDGRISSV